MIAGPVGSANLPRHRLASRRHPPPLQRPPRHRDAQTAPRRSVADDDSHSSYVTAHPPDDDHHDADSDPRKGSHHAGAPVVPSSWAGDNEDHNRRLRYAATILGCPESSAFPDHRALPHNEHEGAGEQQPADEPLARKPTSVLATGNRSRNDAWNHWVPTHRNVAVRHLAPLTAASHTSSCRFRGGRVRISGRHRAHLLRGGRPRHA